MLRSRWSLLVGLILACSWDAAALRAQEARFSPEGALQRLKEGNARFVEGKPDKKDLSGWRRLDLVSEQRPFAVILACSDSRVVPEYLFDQGLGELFTQRVAGNITDSLITGSIEYAVAKLNAPLVVVLGHENCGAVEAALQRTKLPTDNLKQLIEHVSTGDKLPQAKDAALAAAIRTNTLYQAEQLLRQSPLLKDFVASKRIRLKAGVYSLQTGKVEWLEPAAK